VKKIEAIINPSKFDEVKEALVQAGVTGFTVTEASGFSQDHGGSLLIRGTSYQAELVPRLKIEILVSDVHLEQLIDVLEVSAKTGRRGDGKIIVTQLEEVIRIGTGERGERAL
jgi:nitrogen regulatory protein P-II 1